MKIKILKLGTAAHVVDVPAGSSLDDALSSAQLGRDGYSLAVNGLGAGGETALAEGDIVTLTPKVVGGISSAA